MKNNRKRPDARYLGTQELLARIWARLYIIKLKIKKQLKESFNNNGKSILPIIRYEQSI